ncbi:MAG: hypothetical protein ACRELV_17530 [Longimicrobiales bacterium]
MLELITSTNFRRFTDEGTNTTTVTLIRSDTSAIQPPFDSTYAMTGENVGFFLRVTNPDTALASIRLTVAIDDRVVYEQSADMRDASLEYSFVYTE